MYKKMDRLTVAQAADRLGVKEQAVRKRIQRGTLVHDKDEDGRVYVYLDPRDQADGTDTDTEIDRLVQSLQDQIEYLRAELQRREETHAEEARRKDHIIMSLTQRVPELEPPRDEPHAPETPAEGTERVETPDRGEGSQEATEHRSWWRRWFGVE